MNAFFRTRWVAILALPLALWGLSACTGEIGDAGTYKVTKVPGKPSPRPTKDGGNAPDTTGTDGGGSSDDVVTPDGGVSKRVVYFADMKPFLNEFCVNCHSARGSLASTETYDDGRRKREPVAFWGYALQKVEDKKMPPAKPDVADAIDRFNQGIELFRLWKEAGFPEKKGGSTGPKTPRVFDPMVTFPTSASCEGKAPLPSRLWRLTAVQVRHSLLDIFGNKLTVPAIKLSESQNFDLITKKYHGPSNLALKLSLTGEDISGLVSAFEAYAKEILAKVPDAKSCLGKNDEVCVEALAKKYARRLWRRPATTGEVAKLKKDFQELLAATDRETALAYVFERMMLSPHFLMRSEIGTPVAGRPGILKLTPYEVASMLSYTIWQSAPDDTLLQAAEKGELESKEQLRQQIDRMVKDPRARRSSRDLFNDWLKLFQVKTTEKDTKLFPSFTKAIQDALLESGLMLVEDVIWGQKATLETLLTTDKAFANNLTAPFYGLTLTGGKMQPITTKSDQRIGLLSSPAYLSGHAGTSTTSLVHRGVFLLEELACYVFAPPPDGATAAADDAIKGKDLTKMTARQVIDLQTKPDTCNFCHRRINPVGGAFEFFDPIGRLRKDEKGLPIDASGKIDSSDVERLDLQYDNSAQLIRQLAKSERFQQCFTTKLYTHTFGIKPKGEQSCMLAGMYEHLKGNQFTLSQLYQGLIQSDAILLRKEPAKKP